MIQKLTILFFNMLLAIILICMLAGILSYLFLFLVVVLRLVPTF